VAKGADALFLPEQSGPNKNVLGRAATFNCGNLFSSLVLGRVVATDVNSSAFALCRSARGASRF
jgi:hypothetical protein